MFEFLLPVFKISRSYSESIFFIPVTSLLSPPLYFYYHSFKPISHAQIIAVVFYKGFQPSVKPSLPARHHQIDLLLQCSHQGLILEQNKPERFLDNIQNHDLMSSLTKYKFLFWLTPFHCISKQSYSYCTQYLHHNLSISKLTYPVESSTIVNIHGSSVFQILNL